MFSLTSWVLTFAILLSAGFSEAQVTQRISCRNFEQITKGGASRSAQFKSYLDLTWKYSMQESPEWATSLGYPGMNDKLSDFSVASLDRYDQEERCRLKVLEAIPRSSLREADQVTRDLMVGKLAIGVEGQQFPERYLVMSHLWGLHMDLVEILESMPKQNLQDYQNMITRLEKAPVLIQQQEALLREGLKRGITPVKMFLQKVPAQFAAILTEKVDDSPLFAPFREINSSIPEAQRTELQTKARQVLQNRTLPALGILRDYLVAEYIPGARESISLSQMPDGVRWYNYAIKKQTTTSQTAEELHALGLREVERIKNEMMRVKDSTGFKGDLKAFNRYMQTEKKFYFDTAAELVTAYRDVAKQIDAELPKYFGRLPRLPYGVREMPEYKGKTAPAAYYLAGSLEGGRAGFFEANTTDLKGRPKWGIEALTIHEAVPGHHLQIALAQEIEGVHEVRKHNFYTAYVEGWALYAESLGFDMGFYKDPYSKYGALTYEMWRAVRLVVDTGLHSKNWTRDQAIEYFLEQMPKSRTEAEIEIDRYITWPGQALAYKVGQLKFLELREEARRELGEKFDLRQFHDEVLRHGAVPMDVLEKLTRQWIVRLKKAKPSQRI